MEVRTKTSSADYKSFLFDHYFNQKKLELLVKLLLITFLVALVFYNGVYGKKSFSWLNYGLLTLYILPILFIVVICIPYGIKVLLSNTVTGKIVSINIETNIAAYAAGINAENGNNAEFFKWEQIKKIVTSPRYIVILLKDRRLILIPKKDFETDENIKLFLYKIHNGWIGTLSGIKYVKKNNSPSYLWGLIGFIPIIGAINGVIMMLMGVFQYKDYKYCFIGLMGVIFTVVFFKYMDFSTIHTPLASQAFADMAQKDLNGLVKNIEFYKFENKQYPDSLQQLNDSSSYINIYDPILMYRHLHDDGNKLFNYKRVGNKYTLFSSGLDEVPHTKDDIYPQVSISDTSKCGFIKLDTTSLNLHSKP